MKRGLRPGFLFVDFPGRLRETEEYSLLSVSYRQWLLSLLEVPALGPVMVQNTVVAKTVVVVWPLNVIALLVRRDRMYLW
jgi:hypothetical protein